VAQLEEVPGDSLALVPNLGSRFFTEDFPHGLLVVREVARVAGCETPQMDAMLAWAGDLLCKQFLREGVATGDDVQGLPIPQNYGLSSLADLVRHATADANSPL
jgi:opine dehydrogenase